jgi:UDP-N-acetylglucosamine 2-epimerase (non-hydrolysing)
VVAFCYGTTGELIKLAPVLRRLRARGTPMLALCTGQQVQQIPTMLADFGLPEPDVWLRRLGSSDLERKRNIPLWATGVFARFCRRRGDIAERLRAGSEPPLMVVHGDTMSTVVGALLGHALGVPVAHIEAGMRSGNWRSPFPEELNRRTAAKLTRLHFAPGARAVKNLRAEDVKGEIVDTGFNTVMDNLRDISGELPSAIEIPHRFGLVSLHRFELIENRERLRPILELLRESAAATPLLFVDHPTTAAAVDRAGLGSMFDGQRFVRIPRQRYFQFLALLKASSFLVTDSGGSQEECAFLGHPCLIHRPVTEHDTGLGGPVVLSRLDLDVVRDFLADPERLRREPADLGESPSDRIVSALEERGFLRTLGPA